MLINVFLFLLILVRLVTGVRLFVTGRKNKLPNLIWLSAHMVITIIPLLFAPTEGNPLGNLPFSIWVFSVGTCISMIPIIVFNQLTFYKDRKSPAVWVWLVFVICWLGTFYGVTVSESNYNQSPWTAAYVPSTIVIWVWHGWLANQAFKQIESQPSVEHWVKMRYQLMTFYSIVLIIGVLGSFARIVFAGGSALPTLGILTGLVTLIAQITSVTLLFLVWVMPEAFRLWLNRRYQAFVEEQSYEQALAVLNILGTAMSDSKLPRTLAIIAIRKTISAKINSEDSKQIEAYAVKLGYDDWFTFLNTPALTVFLREVANVNPQDVLTRAKYTLRENQSLFTLQAK